MPRQIKKQKPVQKREEAPVEETPVVEKTAEELKAETDALLDAIDEVLEVHAEEFVKSYVQKGGE